MELKKRPRQPRVDPDPVSSPPTLLLWNRVRRQAPAKRPRAAAELAKQQLARKMARCERSGLQPASCFRLLWPLPPPKPTHVVNPPHPFNWHERDMWTEITKHLSGYDLVCLSLTCRWFQDLLEDDSIWRHAFIRDLLLPVTCVPPPRPLHRSWRHLYAAAFDGSHSYYHQRHKHIDGSRMGGFLLETPHMLLAGKLPLPSWVLEEAQVQSSIEMMGASVLCNARPGIWIAGVVQVLDVRHCELFLEEEFWDGTWEYEDLGQHFKDEEATTACCAVFNHNRIGLSYANILRHTKSWIRKPYDWQPKACLTPFAVAINTNLQENAGLLSKFQGMRDLTGDGRIVSIRITQEVI